MKKALILKFFITTILITILISSTFPSDKELYSFRFFIQGNAKGKIFLVIPFRIFYQAGASMKFSSISSGSGIRFISQDIDGIGYMMRTLGFSGKNLAILTAGRNIDSLKKFSVKMGKNFKYIAPGFAKHIEKTFSNIYIVKYYKDEPIEFLRTTNGLQSTKPGFKILMKKALPGTAYLNINFNVYKLLKGVINIFNHSFLPEGYSLARLFEEKIKTWKSEKIDYTATLISSSRKAAKIFNKIKDLKQDNTFTANFSYKKNGEKEIVIHGSAKPNVSIWRELKIGGFDRIITVDEEKYDIKSDKIRIRVEDEFGNGGIFIAELKKI